MSIEIEIKFRVPDVPALVRQLTDLGLAPSEVSDHSDTYLAHPVRSFAQTDEALRIRSEPQGNYLTYKGPKWGGPTKTREELEIPFAGGPQPAEKLKQIFERLSFEPVATITKRRKHYRLEAAGRSLLLALDDAGPLGSFAEIEAIAESENDVPAAQAAVLELAQRLRLSEVEPRSYLRMALDQQQPIAATGAPPDPARPDSA